MKLKSRIDGDGLTKWEEYTGVILESQEFLCFNDLGKWRRYGLWYFVPTDDSI